MRGFVGRVAVASLSNCRELRAEGESTRSLLASSRKHRFLSKTGRLGTEAAAYACTTTFARTRVSAAWHRRSSRQESRELGHRAHRLASPRELAGACKARRPRIQNLTSFSAALRE